MLSFGAEQQNPAHFRKKWNAVWGPQRAWLECQHFHSTALVLQMSQTLQTHFNWKSMVNLLPFLSTVFSISCRFLSLSMIFYEQCLKLRADSLKQLIRLTSCRVWLSEFSTIWVCIWRCLKRACSKYKKCWVLSVVLFVKDFFEEAIVLLNKAIKGEKDEKGLYINRGGKSKACLMA